ncbi:hypothetical protein RDWZM_000106 [Blomia tropicalis]|uniref:G-protein coupled receptors family 1 profile domain-containing protein n=1 Tax=Blomia tropicalis TaxID=40697 RepID=A0A9Q0RQ53_BLOTA|nr:hypothetical protein RDWZM_000106 [Blomia tropicalis]
MVEAISPLLNHTLTATARTMTTTTTTSSSSSSSTPTLTTVDNESVSNDQLSQLLFLPLETSNYLSNVTHLYPSNLDQYLSLSNVSNLTSNDGENELYSFSTNIYNLDESISTSTITTNTSPNVIPTIVLEPDLRIHHPILAIILGLICVVVVFGNVLTMVSIYKERYLHTVTNYFVASLAAADCLVGAIVMPFSVVHEVMNKWWIFGQDWCDLWHSFDVLASTSSILNLCVISLDRYWAITDPITYPSRMTPSKACLFIFGLWLCSSLISFPAIVWWRAVQKEPIAQYRCLFTDDIGYLVFSSTISFYGPLTVMVFTYYRIYVIASQQTRNLKMGVKQIEMSSISDTGGTTGGGSNVSGCASSSDPSNMEAFTLRMHRGGYQMNNLVLLNNHYHHHHGNNKSNLNYQHSVSADKLSSLTKKDSFREGRSGGSTIVGRTNSNENGYADEYDGEPQRTLVDGSTNSNSTQTSRQLRNNKANWSMGRRLAKLAKERKAAKTLGIVMGVFILCWLPFFVANILMGICPETCIVEPDLVLSIVTWLGWINSAMNPIIYACWSKDFRRAFRKLLCSCFISNSNLSYNRNRIYKAPYHNNNRANANSTNYYNYYYKSKMRKNSLSKSNDFFNLNSTTSRSIDQTHQLRKQHHSTIKGSDSQHLLSLQPLPPPPPPPPPSSVQKSTKENESNECHNGENHCSTRPSSPNENFNNENRNIDSTTNSVDGELPLAANVLYIGPKL